MNSRLISILNFTTVKVMIMSRYRFGPYVTDLYRFRANVTQRDINVTHRYRPLQTVTDRYRTLPNFTVTCVTSVTDRNIVCFEQIFKVY
jgi:hypothetical protein